MVDEFGRVYRLFGTDRSARVVGNKLFALQALRRRMLAQGTHITKSHLSYIFSGKADPSLRMLKAIARALDMTLDQTVALIDATSGT